VDGRLTGLDHAQLLALAAARGLDAAAVAALLPAVEEGLILGLPDADG
jgi:hypothetical protein